MSKLDKQSVSQEVAVAASSIVHALDEYGRETDQHDFGLPTYCEAHFSCMVEAVSERISKPYEEIASVRRLLARWQAELNAEIMPADKIRWYAKEVIKELQAAVDGKEP